MLLKKIEVRCGGLVDCTKSKYRRISKSFLWKDWVTRILGRDLIVVNTGDRFPLMDGVLELHEVGEERYAVFRNTHELNFLKHFRIKGTRNGNPNSFYYHSVVTDGTVKEDLKFCTRFKEVSDANYVLEEFQQQGGSVGCILHSEENPLVLAKTFTEQDLGGIANAS